MDQNLEPKGDMELPEVIIKRLTPEQSGIYLKGETSPETLICYVENAWTEEQVQEYIIVQLKLRPQCVKDNEREPFEADMRYPTPVPIITDEGDPSIKRPRPPRWNRKRANEDAGPSSPSSAAEKPPKIPKTVPETDDDDGEDA
jgi:hypothetical protein